MRSLAQTEAKFLFWMELLLYMRAPLYLYMYTFYLSVYSIFNGLEALDKHGVSGRVLGSRMMFSCQALRAFTA